MAETTGLEFRPRRWIAGFAIWTLLALLLSVQYLVALRIGGATLPWQQVVSVRLADWYSCAVFTPAYFFLVRRWPISRRRWARTMAIYVTGTALLVFAKYAIYNPVFNALRPGMTPVSLRAMLTSGFIAENMAFWYLLAIVQAIEYYRHLREQEVRGAQLMAHLSEARLDALTGQLQPHFLFNTLQGISTLIHRDTKAADDMLTRLSELLRHTLRRGRTHELPLAEELELLRLYLGIVEVRFADRLTVSWSVDTATAQALVPHFILQPLVENALEHGIGRRPGRGHIEVIAHRDRSELLLEVRDDGAGGEGSIATESRNGVGLANSRARLEQLYGNRFAMKVGPRSGGGYAASIRIPWHEAPITEPT